MSAGCPLDGDHRVVDELADGRLLGVAPGGAPSGPPCGTQKTFSAAVFVAVFGVGALRSLGQRAGGVPLLEGVGDVLEEDQAEDDVLVLGRVHVAAQLVGGGPELLLEADERAALAVAAAGVPLPLSPSRPPWSPPVPGPHRRRPAGATCAASPGSSPAAGPPQ